jgi:hypothetical protein
VWNCLSIVASRCAKLPCVSNKGILQVAASKPPVAQPPSVPPVFYKSVPQFLGCAAVVS